MYNVPFGKLKLNESMVSLSIVVAAAGLLSRPPEEPACAKNRFGHVGPGMEEYQLSNRKYWLASVCKTGSAPAANPCRDTFQ